MQQTETNPVLSIRNLSVDFDLPGGRLRAVDDLSFDLFARRTLCLVGESGSGKSVTGRAILQLITAPGHISQGEMLYRPDGEPAIDIAKLKPFGREMRSLRGNSIAMIFQEPMAALSPVHTVGTHIEEVLRIHRKMSRKDARKAAISLLDRVKIPDAERAIDKYTFEFSGGMQQRVMIATALACEPKILIADEPTTALDVTTQADVLDLLAELQRDIGMGLLFVTHDIGVVAEVADDVLVMRAGKTVEMGSCVQVLGAPKEPYAQALINSARQLETRSKAKQSVAETAKPVLTLNDVSVIYPTRRPKKSAGFRAVEGVTIDLKRGETLGVLGESGSGKTSLAKALLRIGGPVSGTAQFELSTGQSIEALSAGKNQLKALHRKARFMFQDPYSSLNPRLTIREILMEPLTLMGIDPPQGREAYIEEILEKVGMPRDAKSRFPHAFSGGQRQRICIARALAPKPDIVIADEATAALDVSLRAQILDLMIELQRQEQISFLFISHDISVIRYFCDRVAVMKKGRVVEFGPVDKVCTTPENDYTKSLLASVPLTDPNKLSFRGAQRREKYHA